MLAAAMTAYSMRCGRRSTAAGLRVGIQTAARRSTRPYIPALTPLVYVLHLTAFLQKSAVFQPLRKKDLRRFLPRIDKKQTRL